MFVSCMPCAGSTLVAAGDAALQVRPLSVDRKIPFCSVPIHRSFVTGLRASAYTLPLLVEAVETVVVLSPPFVEIQPPVLGDGAQYPPQTILPLAGNAHPVQAVAELRWPNGIALQVFPPLADL